MCNSSNSETKDELISKIREIMKDKAPTNKVILRVASKTISDINKEANEQINGIISLIAICFFADTGIVLIIRKLSPSTLI